jgi:hypothetical protein
MAHIGIGTCQCAVLLLSAGCWLLLLGADFSRTINFPFSSQFQQLYALIRRSLLGAATHKYFGLILPFHPMPQLMPVGTGASSVRSFPLHHSFTLFRPINCRPFTFPFSHPHHT